MQLTKFHFCEDNTNICDFLRFQILEKWTNLRLPVNVQKQKVFQLQGGFAPDPMTRGSAPGPRWGQSPHTPVIGSRTALAMGPCPLPNQKKNFRLEPPLMLLQALWLSARELFFVYVQRSILIPCGVDLSRIDCRCK